MAKTIDRLIVAIVYAVDRASQDVATRGYAAVAKAAKSTQAAATATALTITAGAVALGTFAVAQAAALDKTAKTAKSLGLASEAYTELAFAADHAGLAEESLIEVLNPLQAKLGEAARGGVEARKAFKALGVSFDDGAGKARTAAEVLPDIADGLGKIDGEGAKADARMRLFGEGGRKAAVLLSGGSEELKKMTERARYLGVSLSSETAAGAERLTDSVTDLKAVVRGYALQVAEVAIPATADFVDGLVDLGAAPQGFLRLGLARAVRALGLALEFVKTPAGKAAAGLTAFGAAVGLVKGAPGVIDAVSKASPAMGQFAKALTSVGPKALLAGGVLLGLALVIDDVIVTAQGGDSVIRRMADAMGIGEETARAFAGVGSLVGSAWGATTAVFRGVGSVVNDFAMSIGFAIPPLEILDKLIASLGRGLDFVGERMEKAARGFGKLARFAGGDESVVVSDQQGGSSGRGGTFGTIGQAAVDAVAQTTVGLAGAARADALGQDATDGFQRAFDQRAGWAENRATQAGQQIAQNLNVTVNATGTDRASLHQAFQSAERDAKRQLDAVDQE